MVSNSGMLMIGQLNAGRESIIQDDDSRGWRSARTNLAVIDFNLQRSRGRGSMTRRKQGRRAYVVQSFGLDSDGD